MTDSVSIDWHPLYLLVGQTFRFALSRNNLKQIRLCLTTLLVFLFISFGFSETDTTKAPKYELQVIPASATDGVEIMTKLHPIGARKLTVGDPFRLTITIKHPPKVPISPLAVDTIDPFGIIEQKLTQKTKGDVMISTFDLQLAAFVTGDLKIPPFRVFFQTNPKDTVLKYVTTDSIPISIVSVLPADMRDINDIKNPIEFPNFLPLIISAILIGAGIITFLGFHLAKRFRRLREMIKPLTPPWEEALAALNRIPVEDWLNNNRIKHYYYTVSEILKRYLERRFLFPAVEQTTTELVQTMKQNKIPERDGFSNFFTRSDMVKYAKFVPPRAEMIGVIEQVKELINKTKPAEIQNSKNQ